MRNDPDLKIENILIYLRKSRSDDPNMSVEEVLASHERQLQEYAQNTFGSPLPESQIFREVVSGETIVDRPVVQQVFRLIESPDIKAVLVIEPQRLSRGDMEDCGRIINLLRYSGTLVVTPMMSYDLSSEYDRKFFEMELTRGNDYLEYTKRILLRGRIASVKQGNFIGTIPPYGYQKTTIVDGKKKSYTLKIDPKEAEAVKLAFHLYVDSDMGFRAIAHALDRAGYVPRHSKFWSPEMLKDMLENPTYTGKVRWNWRQTQKKVVRGEVRKTRPRSEECLVFPGKHPAIISDDLFDRAQQMRGKHARVPYGNKTSNPFAGLLFCNCGRAMSMKKYASKSREPRKIASMVCDNQSNCHTKSVLYSAFCDRVICTLKDAITDFEVQLKNDCTGANLLLQNKIQNLEKDLSRLREKDSRQKDAYENGIYSMEEYASRNAKLQEQIARTAAALEDAKSAPMPSIDYQERIVKFQSCIDTLLQDDVDPAEKNALLKQCIERITYHNEMESRPGIGRHVENIFDLDITLRL